jgi:lipoate-protein ligase B
MADLWVTTLGAVPYGDGLALQSRLRDARQAGAIPDTLLLLEHPPVYTRGRRSRPGDLPLGEDAYRAKGIAIEDSDRGGQVTYHGPGQLVGYPILRIRAVHDYVAALELALVAALADEGIAAHAPEDLTGVWTANGKIASIGVHVSRGVTTHGFAVNVVNDLEPFGWIRPCGEDQARVTSVAHEQQASASGCTSSLSCVRKRAAHRLAETLGMRQRVVSAHRVLRVAAPATGDGARVAVPA